MKSSPGPAAGIVPTRCRGTQQRLNDGNCSRASTPSRSCRTASCRCLPRAHRSLQRGIERVVKWTATGLLVSMHCAAFTIEPRTIPGFSAITEVPRAPVVIYFLKGCGMQQLRLKMDLRGDPATVKFSDENGCRPTLQRLEALDRLPLLSLARWKAPQSMPDGHLHGTKWIGICNRGKRRRELEPYPFRRDPLEISILAGRFRALMRMT